MKDQGNCCEGAGAAQAKTGDQATPLSRSMGMSKTGSALGSKTRSGHPASSTNNLWQGAPTGFGDNENIKGYGG